MDQTSMQVPADPHGVAHLLPADAGNRRNLVPCTSRAWFDVGPRFVIEDFPEDANEEFDFVRLLRSLR